MIRVYKIYTRKTDRLVYASFSQDEALAWMQKKWLKKLDHKYIILIEGMTKEEFDSLGED